MKQNGTKTGFYVIAFFIPVVIMLLILLETHAYPFGDEYSILLGDASEQLIHFYRMLFDRITENKSFLFSWDAGMGFDFLTSFWYYLSNPFTVIILLFGKQNIELGMIFAVALQLGGCAVTTMYYLMHTKNNRMKDEKWNSAVCLLFATAYAMCDYVLAYKFNIMWLMGMMLIPLLMLGVEYLVDRNDARLYGVLLFIGFVSNFYYAWFLCIWAVICFIEQKKDSFDHWKKVFLKFAGTSILSALCAGVILIPSYLAVLIRGAGENNWFSISDFNPGFHASLGDFLNGFFWGHNLTTIDFFTQNNYCGIFVIVLVCFYLFNKNIDRLQKVKRISEIAVLSLAMVWIGAYWVLHGFSIPHMFSNRYAVLLVFLLIMSAFESLYKINEIRLRYFCIVGLILFGLFALVLFAGELKDNLLCYLVTMFLIVWIFICLFLYKRESIKKGTLIVHLCVLGVFELLTNPFISNADGYLARTEQITGAADLEQAYDNIETIAGERKTTHMLIRDTGFSLSQTDVFTSGIQAGLLRLFRNTGLMTGLGEGNYAYIGTTPLMAALFNVRYVITDWPECFGGYTPIDVDDSYGVYEADDMVGFGFVLPETATAWDIEEGNVFDVQNYFSREVLGKLDLFTQADFVDAYITPNACEFLGYTEDRYYYLKQNEDLNEFASLVFTLTMDADMDLYFCSEGTNEHFRAIYLDGQLVYSDKDMSISENRYIIHIGQVLKGQRLDILLSDVSNKLGEAEICMYLYQYHDDVMQECLTEMRKSVYEIDTMEDTYVSGMVNVKEDGILYTSIPYYRGFTAYVDGEKADIVQIGNAMIGVRVSAGEHKIEFRYLPYGLKTGIVTSLIGLLIVIGCFLNRRRVNIKGNSSETK